MSFVHFIDPGEFSRHKHLQMIGAICVMEGKGAAIKYWLRECPGISRKAFEGACKAASNNNPNN